MIQRVLTLLLILSVSLFSRQYDVTLLNIEAKLFPKIAVLEEHVKQKESDTLLFAIVHDRVDLEVAKKFKLKILENYPSRLRNKKINVVLKRSDESLDRAVDVLIFLYLEDETISSYASWANRHNILSFSYDPSDLYHGVVASLYLGKSTKPYLNAEIIKKYNFTFDPYLLRLSRILN